MGVHKKKHAQVPALCMVIRITQHLMVKDFFSKVVATTL